MVKLGLDLLVDAQFSTLKGKNVALLAHPASVDSRLVHLVDRCIEAGVKLVRLFGPEHGILGAAQDMESVDEEVVDPKLNIPVISLYGTTKDSLFLKAQDLEGVDVLLCDLQDIGSRYYTFCYTTAFALRACAQAGVHCMILDRPNPIVGGVLEGNVVQTGFDSFVGEYPLCNRHGLTLGELCHFFQNEDAAAGMPKASMEIVWCEGYNRNMTFAETSLPWVLPSPNMPTVETALVYPGGCLYEGTNLSEGRGTTRPFELIGAPYINDVAQMAQAINDDNLPGVMARPTFFKPMFQKHANEMCGGIQLHVTNEQTFLPLKTGISVIRAAMAFEGFDWRRDEYEFVSDRLAMDLLFGHDTPRNMLEGGDSTDAVHAFLENQRGDHDEKNLAVRHAGYDS
jgi:uncharacterized protein YbbC (DUF1343 family)